MEPAFLTSTLTAASAAGFDLKGYALRTANDPVQLVWERGEHLKREYAPPQAEQVCKAMQEHLIERGEPASYLHLHAAALIALTEAHALKQKDEEFDAALRRTNSIIETTLREEARFIHHSSGEGSETGLWGLRAAPEVDSLTDRVEVAIVNYLQKTPDCIYLEIEEELYRQFKGLLTPSKRMIYAVLNSYAEKDGGKWKLRREDVAASRHQDLKTIGALIETIGRRLKYKIRREDKWLIWEENGKPVRVFYLLASGAGPAGDRRQLLSAGTNILVIPGGRAALIAYKEQRDPVLAERMQAYQLVKYRLWRALAEVPILTRETFEATDRRGSGRAGQRPDDDVLEKVEVLPGKGSKLIQKEMEMKKLFYIGLSLIFLLSACGTSPTAAPTTIPSTVVPPELPSRRLRPRSHQPHSNGHAGRNYRRDFVRMHRRGGLCSGCDHPRLFAFRYTRNLHQNLARKKHRNLHRGLPVIRLSIRAETS